MGSIRKMIALRRRARFIRTRARPFLKGVDPDPLRIAREPEGTLGNVLE